MVAIVIGIPWSRHAYHQATVRKYELSTRVPSMSRITVSVIPPAPQVHASARPADYPLEDAHHPTVREALAWAR